MNPGAGWGFLDGIGASDPAPSLPHNRQTGAHYAVACLLQALGVARSERSISESVWVSDRDRMEAVDLEKALSRLGMETSYQDCSLTDLDEDRLPSLFRTNKGAWWVVTARTESGFRIHDLTVRKTREISKKNIKGNVLLARPATVSAAPVRAGWVADLLKLARNRIATIALVSFVINLMALASPIFVMIVYDRVVGATTDLTLAHLLPGVAIALVADFLLRMLRTELASQTSSELGYVSSTSLFSHLMALPSAMTERSTVSTQLLRLKGFESVRRVVAGSTAVSIIDACFVVIFIVAIIVIAGRLAFVPVVSLLLFAAIGFFLARQINVREAESSRLDQQRQELLIETIDKSPVIKHTRTSGEWYRRFDEVNTQVAQANASNAAARAWLASIGQGMTMGSGLVTLLVGIGLVIDGTMTSGALIATVMLTWRIFGPIQGVFAAGPQIRQARRSMAHVQSFLSLETDSNPHTIPGSLPALTGEIALDRVTFRYGAAEPELANVSFKLKAGEVLAVVGENGSGKSTLLKLLLGLYHPLAGRVLLDSRNLRQFDPAALRRAISYAPQMPRLVAATIRENLSLAEPGASDEDMWAALTLANAANAVRELPTGLDTEIDPSRIGEIPTSLMARISLARVWIRPAPIVLLDEPTVGLDFECEFSLVEAIESVRQHSTVILVTHRPEHIRIADKALVLNHGTVGFFGEARELADRLEDSASGSNKSVKK